jgi:hypothetical protein
MELIKTQGAIFTRPEILMQPQLVKPLHSMAPRTIMGTGWWNRVRQEAYAKNNYHCFACGVHKSEALFKNWLEAHESYSIDLEKKQYKLEELIALCHACHNYIHAGRLKAIFDKKEISEYKYRRILEHGDTLLFINDMDKTRAWWTEPHIHKQLLPEIDGTWDEWHLLLNDIKYYSRFKNYEAWAEYYGHNIDND